MARPTIARPAATTLIIRDVASELQVLMLRRSLSASFMPGSYVFPGGAVDAEDGSLRTGGRCLETPADAALRVDVEEPSRSDALAFMVAALRECFEECGLWLGAEVEINPRQLADARHRLAAGSSNLGSISAELGLALATTALAPWSHWVTPIDVPKRFDTIFFVAFAPTGQEALVDAGEAIRAVWVSPSQALAQHAAGGLPLEFATRHTLESLLPFDTSAGLMQAARSPRHLRAIHPRVARMQDGKQVVLLPHDAAYADVMRLDPEGTGTAVVPIRASPMAGLAGPTAIPTL